jgi:hypothetical protein
MTVAAAETCRDLKTRTSLLGRFQSEQRGKLMSSVIGDDEQKLERRECVVGSKWRAPRVLQNLGRKSESEGRDSTRLWWRG